MAAQPIHTGLALVGIVLMVASCATPQEARDKGPAATYTSTKSAKDISICVATAWESAYGLTNPVNVRPTQDGFTMQVSANSNTMVVLDISDTPNGGSVSKYYKGHVLLEGKWDQAVQSCQ
jgi:hypothetical protein